ncbi:MAG TPA: hypothetical protein VGH38_34815 [Bryobacteraceae bacterium]|jgi:fibronectin type 3 domain-containing protein
MLRPFAALLAAAFLTSGCGYIGSPLPPLANIPARVTAIAAVERDSHIIVHFTVPTLTTEGFPIKPPLHLDLRIGSAVAPFRPEDWAAQAKAVPEVPVVKGLATYEIPTADWVGKDVTIAARAVAANGKASTWSDFINLPIVPPPATPAAFKVESTAEGVRLTWEGSPGDFRVFRQTGDDKSFPRLADVPQSGWTDSSIEFGKHYAYIVQRIVKLGDGKEAESDPSPEAAITPVDTFPPAVPSGLRASTAPESVELSWDRDTEPDLAGYRIYRAAPGGAFERIAIVAQVPSYSDRAVEHGKSYRYAITAVDQSGNESARTAVVEASVP